jgi:hypothetical protein
VTPRDRSADEPDFERDEAMEAALSHVSRPLARAEFRDALRRRFVTAARGASTVPLVDMVEDPPARDAGSRPARWAWPVAIAAAASVVALLMIKPNESRWKVMDGPWTGNVVVDTVSIPVSDRVRLEKSLADAHEIETSGRLELNFGKWYALDLAPGTHLTITPMEQRSRPEPLGFYVANGALRVTTGPDFHGAEMIVATQDLSARITGTNVGVDVLVDGTCVCCLHGEVKVVRPSQNAATVSMNGTLRVVRGRSEARDGEINHAHEPAMKELEEAARRLW